MSTDTTHSDRRIDDAPDPDDPSKPATPRQIEKRSWKYVLGKTIREFSADECTDLAAALTYYGVLSFFPGLIAVFSLLGIVGQGRQAASTILEIVTSVAPGDTAEALREPIEQLASSPAAGFAFVSGLVLAIWSASGYVGAFSRAMNRIYDIEEGRPFWKLRPVQLLVTVMTVILVTACLVILVVSGPIADAVGQALGVGSTVTTVWDIVKWPLLALLVVVMVAILYYATPNAKQPKFRWISLGALVAILVLAIATAAFFLYVANFSSYDRTYGSLAGIVVFLLWMWIANLALLFGAEFDAELERGRELQAGIEAEEELQLPPRDTRKSDKAAEKEKHDIEAGRRIREQHERDGSDDDSPETRRPPAPAATPKEK
ncbi:MULTISPECIES: YihY/virulence factor BrkB family protein [Microbacterium]|uniref:YihY/virulence factor BrkB family protein n=1 Tax=Microbacterium TaxID=33882 RepID=UPI001469CD98|nr:MULTISPECIES: YihY/virulence factor BrkB family protein [Microbacterium]